VPYVTLGRVAWLSTLPLRSLDAHLFAQIAHAPGQTDEQPQPLHCHHNLAALAFPILPLLWNFFMGFRGLKAQSNRRQKPIVCPTSDTEDVFSTRVDSLDVGFVAVNHEGSRDERCD
jgi:hypothetical protein